MKVKRYSPELHHYGSDDPEVRMGESPQGMYVLHADYAKLEEELVMVNGLLRANCDHDFRPWSINSPGLEICGKCGWTRQL